MGMFCNPCCCVCGASPMKRNDEWLQDFCPEHKPKEYVQYIGGEMSKLYHCDDFDKHKEIEIDGTVICQHCYSDAKDRIKQLEDANEELGCRDNVDEHNFGAHMMAKQILKSLKHSGEGGFGEPLANEIIQMFKQLEEIIKLYESHIEAYFGKSCVERLREKTIKPEG